MRSREGDWVTVDDILDHCDTHYRNPKASVMATLKEKWNQDWCESKLENRRRYFRMKSPHGIEIPCFQSRSAVAAHSNGVSISRQSPCCSISDPLSS